MIFPAVSFDLTLFPNLNSSRPLFFFLSSSLRNTPQCLATISATPWAGLLDSRYLYPTISRLSPFYCYFIRLIPTYTTLPPPLPSPESLTPCLLKAHCSSSNKEIPLHFPFARHPWMPWIHNLSFMSSFMFSPTYRIEGRGTFGPKPSFHFVVFA